MSAIVEPIFSVIVVALVFFFLPILPFALSFAAGAMIYVVVEEVIHESQNNGNTDITTLATIAGFCSYDAFRCCSGLDYIYFHFYKIILN